MGSENFCVLSLKKRVAFPCETLHYLAKPVCSFTNALHSPDKLWICLQNACILLWNVVFAHKTLSFHLKLCMGLENFCVLSLSQKKVLRSPVKHCKFCVFSWKNCVLPRNFGICSHKHWNRWVNTSSSGESKLFGIKQKKKYWNLIFLPINLSF